MSDPAPQAIILTDLEAKKLIAGLYEVVDGRHGEKLQGAANDLLDILWMQAVKRYIHELSTDPMALAELQASALAAASKIPAEKYEAARLALRKFLDAGP